MPIATIFTLGLLAPVGSRLAANYLGNGLSYGTAEFETSSRTKSFYANLGVTVLFSITLILIVGLVAYLGTGPLIASLASLGVKVDPSMTDPSAGPIQQMGFWVILVSGYIAIGFSYIFYQAGVRNIAYNATVLDDRHRFQSTISRIRYIWIIFSNFIAVIFTIGLLRPWAAVRTWRYKAAKTNLLASGGLDDFIAKHADEGSAAAQEFLDIEGIDFGL